MENENTSLIRAVAEAVRLIPVDQLLHSEKWTEEYARQVRLRIFAEGIRSGNVQKSPDSIGHWWYQVGEQWGMARVETNPAWNGRLRVWHQGDKELRAQHMGGCCWADLTDYLPSDRWVKAQEP